MTQTYGPLDTGPGSTMTAAGWRTLWGGVLHDGRVMGARQNMEVFGDGSGLNVKVRPGTAVLAGMFFDDDQVETLPIASTAGINPGWVRYDSVVLRADLVANTVGYAVKTGTPFDPAVHVNLVQAPQWPLPTKSSTVWELLLGYVGTTNGTATIPASLVAVINDWATAHHLKSPGFSQTVDPYVLSEGADGKRQAGAGTSTTLPGMVWVTARGSAWGRTAALWVVTSAGNVCAGSYSRFSEYVTTTVTAQEWPYQLQASTGSVPCPATGRAFIPLLLPTKVADGDFLFLGSDSNTAAFQFGPLNTVTLEAMAALVRTTTLPAPYSFVNPPPCAIFLGLGAPNAIPLLDVM